MTIRTGSVIAESLTEGSLNRLGGASVESLSVGEANRVAAVSVSTMSVGEMNRVGSVIVEVLYLEAIPPDAPVNLQLFNKTTTSATVLWDAADTGTPPTYYEVSLDNGTVVNVGLDRERTFTGLTANTSHTVKVRAGTPDAVSAWVTLNFTTSVGVPNPPINLAMSNVTVNSATLGWSAPASGPAPTSYEWSLDGGTATSVTGLSASLTGMTPGSTHTARVRSVNADGTSNWETIQFSTLGAPNPPTGVSASNVTASSATVSWTAPVGGTQVSSYDYSINSSEPVSVGTATSVNLNALVDDTTYSVRVRSVGTYGASAWVEVIFKTLLAAPQIPRAVMVTEGGSTTVVIQWAPPNTGSTPTGYEYTLGGGASVEVGPSTLGVTLTSLMPGSSYVFHVRSKNTGGTSAWVDLPFETNVGAPKPPANLRALRITQTGASIQWDPAPTGPTTLRYEYSFDYSEILNAGTVKQLVLDNLTAGSTHNIRVRSVGAFGTSEWSEITFSALPPDVVPELDLRIQWDQIGVRTYQDGIDRGVLYLSDKSGVAWSGLTALDENVGDEGAEPLYMDGEKYFDAMTMGDYSGNLRALTYPDEFLAYEGYGQIGEGIYADDQAVDIFGLSYRTMIGSDTDEDAGYKIHIVYNLTATPDVRSHTTVSPGGGASEFAWVIESVPETLAGYRPTAHIMIDSRYMNKFILRDIEDILYGSIKAAARMPSIQELIDFIKNYVFIQIFDNGDGTWTARGPDSLVEMIDETTFRISEANAKYLDPDTYTIASS